MEEAASGFTAGSGRKVSSLIPDIYLGRAEEAGKIEDR
jgi:hypothetical protein